MATSFDLSGKVALVTGASRGIGEAIARAYAGAGARVVVTGRGEEALVEAARAMAEATGGEIEPVVAHAGRAEDAERAVAAAVERFGRLDVLVNNAATNPHFGPILTAEPSHWDKTVEVNLKGCWAAIRAAVPRLVEAGGGKIVNVASIAGLEPHPGLGIYSVTKAALLMLTRLLALELAGENIQVNALAPGFIKTRFSTAIWKDPELGQRVLGATPAQRFGDPDDLTGAALYLASAASDFTTGSVMVVDGGFTQASKL